MLIQHVVLLFLREPLFLHHSLLGFNHRLRELVLQLLPILTFQQLDFVFSAHFGDVVTKARTYVAEHQVPLLVDDVSSSDFYLGLEEFLAADLELMQLLASVELAEKRRVDLMSSCRRLLGQMLVFHVVEDVLAPGHLQLR